MSSFDFGFTDPTLGECSLANISASLDWMTWPGDEPEKDCFIDGLERKFALSRYKGNCYYTMLDAETMTLTNLSNWVCTVQAGCV